MSEAIEIVHFGERGNGAPLSDRRAKTRLKLLRAAATVFAARSLPEATVEDVLREAEVSRRTFYQFFADKVDLLAALYANSVNFLHRQRVEATAEASDGTECLLNGFDVYSGFHASSAPIVRVLASEALRPESPLGPMRQELIDRTVELYCKRFEEIEKRSLDSMIVRALVLMSESLHLHMLTETEATAEDAERVRRTIHGIVRKALSAS